MQRPLVWVGIAYVAGEIWAAAEWPPLAGGLFIAVLMILTGRYRRQILKDWAFYMLPVFLMSGFVCFSHALAYPGESMLSDGKAEVEFSGIVTTCEQKENTMAVTLLSADIQSSGEESVSAGILIYMDNEIEEKPKTGDRIKGRGQVEKPERATNPGQFDAAGYYHAKGIDYILWPDDVEITVYSESYRLWLDKLRQSWVSVYRQCFSEEDAGIISAVLLGDKTMLDGHMQELYRRAGIIHILAISGLHISIIGMGIFKLFRKAGLGLQASSCAAGFFVLSYGVMTGLGPSTKRAVIMFLVRMGAVYLGRSYDMLSALSLAALIIFTRQPLMVTQSGVQFSFAAVLSIGVLWPAISKRLAVDKKTRWGKVLLQIGPSAAVTIGTLPLTAYYYGEVPLVSFFLNLIVLPLMDILVPIGLAAGLAGFIWMPMGRFLGGSIHGILAFTNKICEWSVRLPFSVRKTGVPPLWLIGICYGTMLLFVILSEIEKERKRQLLALLVVCGVVLFPFRKMIPMVAFLDVGQGDCIFVRCDSGTTWLIDGGSSDVKEAGKYRLLPFLDYYGEDGVDYACVSHGDGDHISGIRELLEADKIRHLVLSQVSTEDGTCMELAAIAAEHQVEIIYIEKGDCWRDGEWRFECLWPLEKTTGDKNDQSVVLKLQVGETDFLLTGDVSEMAEMKIDKEKLAGTDVLKVAHHGSGSSSSQDFLEAAGAKIAIISCGEGNRYGHPSEETLSRLQSEGMDIYLTMRDGAILMRYRKGRFEIETKI